MREAPHIIVGFAVVLLSGCSPAEPPLAFTNTGDVAESGVSLRVPVERLRMYVPDHFELRTDEDGLGGVIMTGAAISNFTTDDEPNDQLTDVHTAIEIVEPVPPDGVAIDEGAEHFYDLNAFISQNDLYIVKREEFGLPTSSHEVAFEAQRTEESGFLSAVVPGWINYQAVYGPLRDYSTLSVYFWYEAERGLTIYHPTIVTPQVGGADIEVCVEPDTWFAELVSPTEPCRTARGFIFYGSYEAGTLLFAQSN